jgi:hypothetical protein
MFVALGILNSMRMRHIFICGLSGCTINFSTLSHNRPGFRKKKKLLNVKYGFFYFLHDGLKHFLF